MLTSMELLAREDVNDIIWNKSIPLKVSLFPSKKIIYLFADYYVIGSLQRIIQLSKELVRIMLICVLVIKDVNLCVSIRCWTTKNIDYLFLGYDFFETIWGLFMEWIEVHSMNLLHLSYHIV